MIDIPDPDTTAVPCPWHPIVFPSSHLVLTKLQRGALALTREGMTGREIAAVLGVSRDCVYRHRWAAYRALRRANR